MSYSGTIAEKRAKYNKYYHEVVSPCLEKRKRNYLYEKNGRNKQKVFIDSTKEGKPCMDCGGYFPVYVMDYDHRRGKKVMGLCDAWKHRWSAEKILAEIEKCDLVCSNCHRIRTHGHK